MGAWTSTLLELKGGTQCPSPRNCQESEKAQQGRRTFTAARQERALSRPVAAAGGGPVRTLTPRRDKASCPCGPGGGHVGSSKEAPQPLPARRGQQRPGEGAGRLNLALFSAIRRGPFPKPDARRGPGENPDFHPTWDSPWSRPSPVPSQGSDLVSEGPCLFGGGPPTLPRRTLSGWSCLGKGTGSYRSFNLMEKDPTTCSGS